MAEKHKPGVGCLTSKKDSACCRVESIISIDERGQMVLPKELREKVGIHPGDKLAVVSFGKTEAVCCLALIKAEDLGGQVRDILGPIMKDMVSD
jgi:AbrB family looped-hinge helix DNA binding protein